MDTQSRPAAPKGAQQKSGQKPKAPAKAKAPRRSGTQGQKGHTSK